MQQALKQPELAEGERYIGAIISADGSRSHHIILLPGEAEAKNWQDATDWAASIGGELPDRVEGALLFATAQGEFKPDWYWTRETHSADPAFAWCQDFCNGYQTNDPKDDELRARAVRRLPI